jgi:diacylglycerol kinase
VAALLSVGVALLTAVAALLVAVSVRSWLHTRSRRVLLLTVAFSLFLAKGLLLTIGIFRDAAWKESLAAPGIALDVAALVVLYLAVLRSG